MPARALAQFRSTNPADVGGDGTVLVSAGAIVGARVPVASVSGLALDPRVRAIELPSLVQSPRTNASVSEIRADQVHAGTNGLPPTTGHGVILGVIDTGLDVTHPDFSGDGRGIAGKPAVSNLSLGSAMTGSHDGTTLYEEALSSMTGEDRIIVAAAGNDGERMIHAGTTISASTNPEFLFTAENICLTNPGFCPGTPGYAVSYADI